MWGFGGKSTPKKAEPNADKQRRRDPFDFNFEDPVIDDDDVDDPALLAELHGLTQAMGGASKPAAKPPAKAAPKPTKAAPPARQPAPQAPSQDEFDVEALVGGLDFGKDEDVEVELTDADLKDPALLAMLKEVGGNVSDEEHEHLEEESPTVSKQTSEQDLSAAFVSPVHNAPASAAAPKQSTVSPPPPDVTQDVTPPVEDETVPLEYKLKAEDPSVLDKYVKLEKIRAVNKKRAGDKAGALESVRNLKALEARLQEVTEAIEQRKLPPPPKKEVYNEVERPKEPAASTLRPASPVVTPQPLVQSAPVLDLDDVPSIQVEAAPDASPPQVTLEELQRRQLEYKQAAVQAKHANDLVKAREMLSVSKTMQEAIDALSSGQTLPDNYTIPFSPFDAPSPQPSPAPSSSGTSTPRVNTTKSTTQKQSASNTSQPLGVAQAESIDTSPTTSPQVASLSSDIFTLLETKLTNQISLCTTVSAHYFKSNAKEKAVTFHRLKKNLQSDLDILASLKATPNARPPAFVYQVVEYEVEQAHTELAVDELEVGIVRAYGLSSREVAGADIESYVNFDVGWPEEGGEGKGDTPVVKKTVNPEYGFTKKIKIERTKGFQRYLERKKATFDVYHYRGVLFGLAGKKVSLGRATVKIDALLNKCEVHEVVELVDPNNPRRSMGGKLEIHIKLRTPLLKRDVTKKQEKWVVLDLGGAAGGTSTAAAAAAAAPTTPQPARAAAPKVATGAKAAASPATAVTTPTQPSAKTPSPQQPKPAAQPQQAAKPAGATQPTTSPASATAAAAGAGGAADADELEMRFLSPDYIISNQVLEHEHNQILAQIAAAQKERKSVDDLMDRKTQYQIRMNLLVTLVQAGSLTMSDYIKKVKEAITSTKSAALTFKKAGKLELAKQAMTRIKLMTDEVEEVEREMGDEL
ncbi:Coiled-coil and C2 domain-containing protein 1B [Rhizophlyctis rosea]|nr:Coiled-coil and C2 domain-containing protein 1B [Rhizophlyctis rosea]